MRAVVLYAYPPGLELRAAVERHLHVLDGGDDELLYHNALEGCPPTLARLRPDAVVLHTTFLCLRWFEDFDRHRSRFAWLAALNCPKLALPQDEYDHSEVLDEWLAELGATHVYSNFGASLREQLYPTGAGGADFREALTGYVDEEAAATVPGHQRPLAERPHDIVYRATRLPYWFGHHGQLKSRIAEAVASRATAHGLATDISTRPEDTILSDPWWDFLGSGRVVIGCESGSSVLDPRGEHQARIRGLLAVDPDLTFEEVSSLMPPNWDSGSFFAISPRHLEAVLTRTCQVLVEGSYSGVLEPNRHYIPLRRDFADLDEVLDRVRDLTLLEQIVEQAYEDVVGSGRYEYAAFARRLREDLRPGANRSTTSTRTSFAVARASVRVQRALRPAGRLRLIPKALAAASTLARRPRARRLLRAYFRDRREIAGPELLAELVELEQVRVRAASSPVALQARQGSGRPTLVITTGAEPQAAPVGSELAETLRGGASVVLIDGTSVGHPRSFPALAALGERHPVEVAGALVEAVASTRPDSDRNERR